MSSQIAICNQALTQLGVARIISLNDDVKAARSLTAVYDIVVNAELRAFNWHFAMARASLPALSTTPDWGYDLEYQVPSDFLRMVQVDQYMTNVNAGFYNNEDNSPYSIEGGKILTNIRAPLKIRYIKTVTDTNLFDSCFADMLATKLAMKCCEDLTNSSGLKQALADEYRKSLQLALKGNAIETASSQMADGDWLTYRL